MTKVTGIFTSSIQRKILSSFAIVIFLVLVMVGVGYYQLNQVRVSAGQIPEDSSQVAASLDLVLALTSLEANLERFFVIGGTQFQDDINADLEMLTAAFKVHTEGAGQADDDQTMQQVEEKINSLAVDVDGLVGTSYGELSSREVNEKIIAIYSEIDTIKELTRKLSTEELEQLQAGALEQENTTSNVMTQFLVLGVLTSLIVVGASVLVTRSIATPLAGLAQTANQIAQGNLEAEVPVIKQKDEVGQLAGAFVSMTTQLRQFIGSLEDRVQARTNELALSMEVGQRASTIRNVDELLPTITEFIRDRFDLYYSHVYFADDIGKNLIIAAGTGAVGEQLMARRHSLPIGSGSIVGQVAATGRSIMVSDTETSDIHKPNPLLPDTRSELAVPLMVEGRVIGVLDMQSDQIDTFTEANLIVFEAMATQLSISIDSAQQWALATAAQKKSEETLKQLTQQQWAERLGTRREALGFAYNLSAISPLQPTDFDGGVSAPVTVQNQNIGQLAVSMPNNRKMSEDEKAMLNAVAQQLAQKAENLRLFEETQQQATREQLARQIADKIRASRDIETALNTAAQELSKALGLSKAQVDLEISSRDAENDN